nr:cytochrome P450 71A2-like [Tanacetum cinerariifolium]
MLLHLGSVPVLIVSSVDAAREIMKAHEYAFLDRGELGILRKLTYDGKDIALSDYGEHWRKLKSLVSVHLLSNKQVQSFQRVWEEEIALMIDSVGETSVSVVDLSELLLSSVNSIICRITFGRRYNDTSFIDTVEEFKKIVVVLTVGQYIPWLSWVDRLRGINVRTEKVAKKFDEFLEGVIEECLNKNIERSNDLKTGMVEQGKYFIDILLDKQKEAPDSFLIDRDTIKAILLDMFSGAADTTFTTLEWALSELVRNPQVMKKLQDEVHIIAQGRPKITEEDIGKLKYLHAVLKETMRLHAPAPLVIRTASQDVKVMGYDIKAKTRVFVNLWALGQDPRIWEEHEEFKPERFLNSHFDYKENDYGFIPFGGGKRGCPGIHFANTLMELILANVVYKFDFALPKGESAETLDMSESNSLTIYRKNHLLLVPTPQLEASSLPLVEVWLSTPQPPPYTMEDGIRPITRGIRMVNMKWPTKECIDQEVSSQIYFQESLPVTLHTLTTFSEEEDGVMMDEDGGCVGVGSQRLKAPQKEMVVGGFRARQSEAVCFMGILSVVCSCSLGEVLLSLEEERSSDGQVVRKSGGYLKTMYCPIMLVIRSYSIDGIGNGVLTKKETKKDDIGVPKEPNIDWKLNKNVVPYNENVYHYLWHLT